MLKMILKLRPQCAVCRDETRDGAMEAVLFGYARYAVCCSCRKIVSDDCFRDPNYRARFRRWEKKSIADSTKEAASDF
jgi:hypothetical protein